MHMLGPLPSMLATRRSTCVATTTSNAQLDYICCGTADSKPSESLNPTNQRTRSFGEEIYESLLSSSDRYPDRLLTGESLGIATAHSPTTLSCSRPKNHCTRTSQRSTSISQYPGSIRQTGLVCALAVGHDRAPWARCRQSRFVFFPP